MVRAVALLLVVVIHCAAWPAQRSGAPHLLYPGLTLASQVSVPLFVVLSGLLLSHVGGGQTRRWAFWRRRLGRTVGPWVCWAAVFFAIAVLGAHMSPNPVRTWGWWAGGAGHLYFLLLIPQLYLLLLVWPRGRRASAVALVVAGAVQVGLQLLRVLAPLHGPAATILLDFGFEEAPLWVGYFALGIFLGRHQGWLGSGARWAPAVLALAVASEVVLFVGPVGLIARHWGPWVGGTGAFLRPTLLLTTALVFTLLWWAAPALLGRGGRGMRRVVAEGSRHSLGIYIVHPLFLLVVGPQLQRAPAPLSLEQGLPGSLLPFAVLVAGAAVSGWWVSRLLAASRWTAWTVGVAPTR